MAQPPGDWQAYQHQYAASGHATDPYGQSQHHQQQFSQAGYTHETTTSTSYPPGSGHGQAYDAQPQAGFGGAFYQQQQPQQPFQRPPQGPQGGGGFGGQPDAFVADLATGMLRQHGENYFQRGQAYVQSKMGWLSAGSLQHHFNVDGAYVRDKLLLLLLPFLRQWDYQRKPEQISGGHRYQPPCQDTHAPDLYLPFMAACTYVLLVSGVQTAGGRFTHDSMYLTVSGAATAWAAHWVVLKAALWLLGAPSAVPLLEALAYAGYPFVWACLGLLAAAFGGLWPYRALWAYGSLAMGTFLVRTLKRVLLHDSPHFSGGARSNYLLLGLALFQFPFLAWLYVRP